MVSSSSSPSVDGRSSSAAISTVHSDIIQTHILSHLDGLSLASAACASSHLYSLATEEKLWRDLSSSTWPSVNDPRVQNVISTFPCGHRSFFSDSFPLLDYRRKAAVSSRNTSVKIDGCYKLISAVDIFYRGELIFSKVEETETITSWFMCSPFRVDLLQSDDFFLTPDHHQIPQPDNSYKDTWQTGLLKDLTLSWILIDPTRRRAVNLSSNKAVSVERHWLTGEVQVRFAAVVPGGERGTAEELVECAVVVTCGRGTDGRVQVSEVGMSVEDMEKRNLSGRESLVILQETMERVKRVRGNGDEGKQRYEEFVEKKRVRERRSALKNNVIDTLCILIGVTIFVIFWWLLLFRRK